MKQNWCKALLTFCLIFWLQPGYSTELPQLQKVGSGKYSYSVMAFCTMLSCTAVMVGLPIISKVHRCN